MATFAPSLFGEPLTVNQILSEHHYLGPTTRGEPYQDDAGVMVFANPSSRFLPQQRWLELIRWCIVDRTPNAGSRQWRRAHRWLMATYPSATTVVSYSDPAAGHTGALYRACNWLWARLIVDARPRVVFGEQVAAASDWFDRACADLDAVGYETGAAILPALALGFDHARARIYFASHAHGDRQSGRAVDGEASWLSRPRGERLRNG